ncbi:MAG: hypothetical protein K1X83_05360 [Oligoflexia bacterium]|nr:hypothetical protein [Oligoflexia bacterium]
MVTQASAHQRQPGDGATPWISAHQPEGNTLHDLTAEAITSPPEAIMHKLSIEERMKNYQSGVDAALARIDRASSLYTRNFLIAAGALLAASVGGCFAANALESTGTAIAGFFGICGAIGLFFTGACTANHRQSPENTLLSLISNFRELRSDAPGQLLQVSGMSLAEMGILVESMANPIRRGDSGTIKLSTDMAVNTLQEIGEFMLKHRSELESMGTSVPPAQWFAAKFRDLAKSQQMSKETASFAGKAYKYFTEFKEASVES